MASTKRRLDRGVIARLKSEPQTFDLVQAVALMERAGLEPIRYRTVIGPEFPPSDIAAITPEGPGAGPVADAWVLETPVMSLFGPQAPLPTPLAEAVRERTRQGEPGIRAFFDLFVGRLIAVLVEQLRLERPSTQTGAGIQGQALMALIGAVGRADAPSVTDRARLGHAGLLHQRPGGVHAAERVLGGSLGVRVRISPFQGGWVPLEQAEGTRLGGRSPRHALGVGSVIGARVWLQDKALRVMAGPMTAVAAARLFPGTDGFRRLSQLARALLPEEADVQLVILLGGGEAPPARLGQARLGWTSFLGADRDPLVPVPIVLGSA